VDGAWRLEVVLDFYGSDGNYLSVLLIEILLILILSFLMDEQ
jgi:hypothetical protein